MSLTCQPVEKQMNLTRNTGSLLIRVCKVTGFRRRWQMFIQLMPSFSISSVSMLPIIATIDPFLPQYFQEKISECIIKICGQSRKQRKLNESCQVAFCIISTAPLVFFFRYPSLLLLVFFHIASKWRAHPGPVSRSGSACKQNWQFVTSHDRTSCRRAKTLGHRVTGKLLSFKHIVTAYPLHKLFSDKNILHRFCYSHQRMAYNEDFMYILYKARSVIRICSVGALMN